MQNLEIPGVWWFPDVPGKTFTGILKYSQNEGAVLELFQQTVFSLMILFEVEQFDIKVGPVRFEDYPFSRMIICGDTKGGNKVTLYECVWEPTTLLTNNAYQGSSIFRVTTVFLGHHFEHPEDCVFDKLSVSFTHLEEWLGLGGVQQMSNTEMKYKAPQNLKYSLPNFDLAFNFDVHYFNRKMIEIGVVQKAFMEITPTRPINFAVLLDEVVVHCRNFLAWACNRPVVIDTVYGELKTEESSKEEFTKVRILFPTEQADLDQNRPLNPHQILLPFSIIEHNAEHYFRNWFRNFTILEPVFNQFFGMMYVPMYVPLQFLTIAQAIESFHRNLYGGKYMDDNEWKAALTELRNRIPATLSSSHKSAIYKRLQYLNEYSLPKRVKDLLKIVLKDYKEVVDSIVDNYELFATQLADTRNYLTHPTPEPEPDTIPILDTFKQREFVERMRLILCICFFKEIDLPPEVVKQLMLEQSGWRSWV